MGWRHIGKKDQASVIATPGVLAAAGWLPAGSGQWACHPAWCRWPPPKENRAVIFSVCGLSAGTFGHYFGLKGIDKARKHLPRAARPNICLLTSRGVVNATVYSDAGTLFM